MCDYKRKIRWAWQRLTRGYDDRVIWSIDIYLAKMIPIWVEHLIRVGGVTGCFCHDEDGNEIAYEDAKIAENEVFQKIIDGFRAYYEIYEELNYEKEEELSAIYEEGFDAFREYFGTLWT